MALANEHFLKLPDKFFLRLRGKNNLFKATHPKADSIRLGTGDAILPLNKTITIRNDICQN